MARHKDEDWILYDPASWNDINAALLMDIRDELKRLNSILHCASLKAIRVNTRKYKKKVKLKAVKRRVA